METFKINDEEVDVSTLPLEIQVTFAHLSRIRNDLKDLTTKLNDSKILHEFYNEMLRNQVVEYLKSDEPI
ncbi:hypothetical protein [Stenotrophomonas phage RAS14]